MFALRPESLRCPYPAYVELRDDAPVAFAERLNSYVVTRHDRIVEVLRNPALFSSLWASGPGGATSLARRVADDPTCPADLRRMALRRLDVTASPVLITADPPLHSRQRNLVNRAFTQRQVAAMEAAIQAVTDALIDSFIDDGEADIMQQLAIPLPLSVIADTLGVSRDNMPAFKRWSEAFVEETLRLEAPVQGLFRTATRDTEVGGMAIPEGAHLWLVYGSGNRDDHAYDAADELDLERVTPRNHLTFGFGEHYCIGAGLARAETRIAVESVLTRLPGLRRVGGEAPCNNSLVIHGLTSLRVAFG